MSVARAVVHVTLSFLRITVALAWAVQAFGQPPTPSLEMPADLNRLRDSLGWADGLRGRLQQIHNPVVLTYSMAKLGALVCSHDRTLSIRFFKDAVFGSTIFPQTISTTRSTCCPYLVLNCVN
jgi:hypothetical protein